MSVRFHTIVELSDKTTIEYDQYAASKIAANKSILGFFGYRGIKSIRSCKA